MSKHDKYNARYNNQTYQAVRDSLINDLQTDDNSLALSDIMNALTDASLQIAGGKTDDKIAVLIRVCHSYEVSPQTIRLMSQHLENFEETGDIHSANFENSALVLCHLREISKSIAPAVALSEVIHCNEGRVAHYFIMASQALLDATYGVLLRTEEGKEKIAELQRIQAANNKS